MTRSTTDADVIIVGAGLSGLSTALQLRAQRISFILIEKERVYPDLFRAERFNVGRVGLLEKYGLLDLRSPPANALKKVIVISKRWQGYFDKIEVKERGVAYGIRYDDTINNIRTHIEETDGIRPGVVREIKTGEDVQEVILEDGSSVKGRLVVIATGPMSRLVNHLGMERRLNPKLRSTAFGFDIGRVDNQPFNYEGITYFLNPRKHQIISITIFAIGNKMRLNMFAQWDVNDPRIRRMREQPIEELHRYFPKLKHYTGEISATSKVQWWAAQFGRLENVIQPGVVVMADTYQWVDPTSGFGLAKTMMDVHVLSSRCIPSWIETEGMGSDKIEQFYGDSEKRNLDDEAVKDWYWWYRKVHYSIPRKIVARIWRKIQSRINS